MNRGITDRLATFQVTTGYQIQFGKFQRICEFPGTSGRILLHESEVFASGISSLATEDELIPYFATVGTVVRFKLLLFKNNLYNRGFAIISYCDPSIAERSVRVLNAMPFNGTFLKIERVTDNCRLFVGGIPEMKTKDEIWNELFRNGVTGIVDIIMYRSYRNRSLNRGYVFVEFHSFEQAAQTRILSKNLVLWGKKIAIDWSEPIPNVAGDVMTKVKRLFVRNIEVTMTKATFEHLIRDILGNMHLEKVYKFKDYAFIHFRNRRDAQCALQIFNEFFRNSFIEVTWAKPQEFAPRKKRYGRKVLKSNIENPKSILRRPQADCQVYCSKEPNDDDNNSILDSLEESITRILRAVELD